MAQARQMPVPKLKELKEKLSKDLSHITDDKKSDEARGFQADSVGPFLHEVKKIIFHREFRIK